jgi:hypothetical protein
MRGPGLGLLIIGSLQVAPAAVLLLVLLVTVMGRSFTLLEPDCQGLASAGVSDVAMFAYESDVSSEAPPLWWQLMPISCANGLLGTVMVIGALNMLRIRSYI